MKKMSIVLLTSLLTLCGATAALAQDTRTPEEKSYQFRAGLFKTIEWKFSQMIGAKFASDEAAFKKHAGDLAYLAGLITEGFELKDSLPEGTKAKKEIWEDWDDFVEKAGDFQKNAQALADSGDFASFDFKKFGSGNCGACHRNYKERD